MKARHKMKKADGGAVKPYDAQGSNVEKEADERKRGGRVKKAEHKVEGDKPKMHMGRPGRKRGGRVGADKSPFSSAGPLKSPQGHTVAD